MTVVSYQTCGSTEWRLMSFILLRLRCVFIIFTFHEKEALVAELAEERRSRALRGNARALVRLLVCAGGASATSLGGDALRSWARRNRYELVSLTEEPDPDSDGGTDGPFPETYGLDRVRATLHAHPWRGLERIDQPMDDEPGPAAELAAQGSDSEHEHNEGDDPEVAVERAERFAAALGALGAVGGALGDLPSEERLAAAEQLVGEFCRALGVDLPAL
ncbi:uncharacterized protein LOC116778842 isoform X2 [Danaus plexippus]|uniref:uncharacterized protein LOC116778842 isoform X2 n=1 Tax=Danaus plexippus TaxID=13037 RepID=UPI002AB0BB86|nr:uncharacterized protein LOC116778842 isoform X2 [Danaus plexippus]